MEGEGRLQMAKDYVLITDSTCDLPLSFYKQTGTRMIAMHYMIDGQEYADDGVSLSSHDFYEKMRGGAMPSTMQVNVQRLMDEFTDILDSGKDLIYITFSSALSGTYNAACMAARELSEKYIDSKIYVVDSLCACGGEGMLVYHTAQKKAEGLDIDSLKSWIEENRYRQCHFFMVNDLFHLHRGGRVSKTSAIVGSLVGIKPAMYVNNLGQLCVGSKVRGRQQAFRMMVDKMMETIINPGDQLIIINHADSPEDAESIANDIRSRTVVKEIQIMPLGPVIGAHVGPGCMAVFSVGTERKW